LVGADHALRRRRQRCRHHHDVGLAQKVVEPVDVTRPGQTVCGGIHPTRSGDGDPRGTEGAEQFPGELADVTESDEADAGVAQRLGLRDRVVVHRGGPPVAAQRPVLARKSRRNTMAAASTYSAIDRS
jgi:hypothetical protein